MSNKAIPPKATFVKSRDEVDKRIEQLGEGIKYFSQQEYVAFMSEKHGEALVAREKRSLLQAQHDALLWVTMEEKK
jgi:hypothetical protein